MKRLLAVLLVASTFSSCSAPAGEKLDAHPATILPETLSIPLLPNGEIIEDCKYEGILTNFAELTCVNIAFPPDQSNSELKETFAIELTNRYAARIVDEGWALTTDWKLLKVFEKPFNDECSTKVKIMTWLVDEAKPAEKRNFETSRFTFLRDNETVCGDKRKAGTPK